MNTILLVSILLDFVIFTAPFYGSPGVAWHKKKAAFGFLVLNWVAPFYSNLWFLSFLKMGFFLVVLTRVGLKQAHAQPGRLTGVEGALPEPGSPVDDTDPSEEILNPSEYRYIRESFMRKLPPVDQVSESALFNVGCFLTAAPDPVEVPTRAPTDFVDTETIDYLLINRKYFSTSKTTRILLGITDHLLRERPIAIELNSDSAARLLAGLTYMKWYIKKCRQDFNGWFLDQDVSSEYTTGYNSNESWLDDDSELLRESEDGPDLINFEYYPFDQSRTPTPLQVTTLLNYPRLREFYDKIRTFRSISIPYTSLRCLPENLTLQDTLNFTEDDSVLFIWKQTLRQEITRWCSFWLWETMRNIYNPDALTFIANPLTYDDIIAIYSAQNFPLEAIDGINWLLWALSV